MIALLDVDLPGPLPKWVTYHQGFVTRRSRRPNGWTWTLHGSPAWTWRKIPPRRDVLKGIRRGRRFSKIETWWSHVKSHGSIYIYIPAIVVVRRWPKWGGWGGGGVGDGMITFLAHVHIFDATPLFCVATEIMVGGGVGDGMITFLAHAHIFETIAQKAWDNVSAQCFAVVQKWL